MAAAVGSPSTLRLIVSSPFHAPIAVHVQPAHRIKDVERKLMRTVEAPRGGVGLHLDGVRLDRDSRIDEVGLRDGSQLVFQMDEAARVASSGRSTDMSVTMSVAPPSTRSAASGASSGRGTTGTSHDADDEEPTPAPSVECARQHLMSLRTVASAMDVWAQEMGGAKPAARFEVGQWVDVKTSAGWMAGTVSLITHTSVTVSWHTSAGLQTGRFPPSSSRLAPHGTQTTSVPFAVPQAERPAQPADGHERAPTLDIRDVLVEANNAMPRVLGLLRRLAVLCSESKEFSRLRRANASGRDSAVAYDAEAHWECDLDMGATASRIAPVYVPPA